MRACVCVNGANMHACTRAGVHVLVCVYVCICQFDFNLFFDVLEIIQIAAYVPLGAYAELVLHLRITFRGVNFIHRKYKPALLFHGDFV